MEIDGVKICEPIENLIDFFSKHTFRVIDEKISDYHFHEVFILMEGEDFFNIDEINIEKINKVSNSEFVCECHWSIVKINILLQ